MNRICTLPAVREFPVAEDAVIVVQETESTGAGKHPLSQLNFAQRMGIDVVRGDPRLNVPGQTIVIPEHPAQLAVVDMDMAWLRRAYVERALQTLPPGYTPTEQDVAFLAADTKATPEFIWDVIKEDVP